MRRRRIARALVVAASVVLLLALVAAYVRHALIDSDQFANRASAALRDDSVRTLIAERITDQVVLRNQSDLIAARPIIESVTADVVGSGAFTSLFGSAVRDVHRALFQRDQNTLTLTVADVGTVSRPRWRSCARRSPRRSSGPGRCRSSAATSGT